MVWLYGVRVLGAVRYSVTIVFVSAMNEGRDKSDTEIRQQTVGGIPCIEGALSVHVFNPLKPELNPICYLLALLGARHFLHVNRIRVKLLTFRLLMSYIYIYIYIYGAPILDVSRSHTTTQHSR